MVIERLKSIRTRVRTSLGARMTLVMGVLATTTAVVLAALSFAVSQHLITERKRDAFNLQSDAFSSQLVFQALALQEMLLAMAGNAFISNALVDSSGRDQYLIPFLRDAQFPGHWSGELWLVDFEGKPVAGNSGDFRFDHQDSPALHEAMHTARVRAELVHDHDLLLAAPVVFPPTGSVEGAMVTVVNLNQVLAHTANLVSGKSCFVLQAGSRDLQIPEGCRSEGQTRVVTRTLELPGSFRTLEVRLHLYVPDETGMTSLKLALGYLIVVGAVVFMTLLVGRSMMRRIVQPLVHLTETADRIVCEDRLDLRAPEFEGDETGRLATAFNRMVSSLQDTHVRLAKDIARRQRLEDALRISEENYRLLIDNQSDLVFKVDRERRFLFVSPSYCRVFGVTDEELLGESAFVLQDRGSVADGEGEANLDVMAKLLHPPYGEYHEQKTLTRYGWRWFGWVCTGVRDDSGEVDAIIGVGRDITEQKLAEEALFAAKELAQVTLHSIGDAVITTDRQAYVTYLNPVAEQLTGWPISEARGQPLSAVFCIVDEETRQPSPSPVDRCLDERRVVGLSNHSILLGRHGGEYSIDDSAAPIRGRDGQLLGAVLVFHDVTETRRLARQLEHDATHDALTGLINRAEFERRLEKAVASAYNHGARHALCFLDLDQFKVVNDTAGHAAGDELLRQVRNLMSSMFRERDTLARIGGDEFGLLLNHCPFERALAIAQSVVSAVRDFVFHWGDRHYQIGVSIGLVAIDNTTESSAQLLTQADVACYTAKELGRNQVHVYQKEDSESAVRHNEIIVVGGLREALDQGRFRLHYQPIVSLEQFPDGVLPTRYEVLLRVREGDGSSDRLLLPAAFIPAAERYGLMGGIDRWVIEAALRDFAHGIGRTGAQIAINLSGNSLSDDGLLTFIEMQLATHAIPPERVCFEITETTAIHNLRRAVDLMVRLKAHGSQMALDDFGSGLSSFHYLKNLPVDYLKIDGSFVHDMHTSNRDRALVAAVNQMAHTLGIKTVAEYAHSEEIVILLHDMGVDYAQGSWFGEPAPWSSQ